jgi:hypothetical protein
MKLVVVREAAVFMKLVVVREANSRVVVFCGMTVMFATVTQAL